MKRLLSVAVVALLLAGLLAACDPEIRIKRDIVVGLDHPWDVAFLADGTMFFSERSGPIGVRLPNRTVQGVVEPADVLDQGGEGGMLGITVHPSFSQNRFLYACYSSDAPAGDATDNRVVRFTVNAQLNGITAQQVIVSGMPHNPAAAGRHSGCRPRFGPDGFLWIGTGDAAQGANPQSPTSLGGKVLRVDAAGAAAPGNNPPPGFDDRIYTYGHRNVQGIAFRGMQAFSIEHGPGRDDEVNKLVNGANYGWDPVPGYNESVPMTDKTKFRNAKRAKWNSGPSTIAPSGATFLAGAQWQDWNGALAVAVLKNTHVRLLFFDAKGRLTGERVGIDTAERLRSAVLGPDGRLYVTTDVGGGGGSIWRIRAR